MDKYGRLLTNEEDQERRWTEHFTEVLNRPGPQHPADVQPAERDLEIERFPPEKAEVKSAIATLFVVIWNSRNAGETHPYLLQEHLL
ncbi:hypothetical protein LSAT2_008639, partial [Lamellibrachia satsuma]